MEWREHGIILRSRKHAETAAIVDVLTRDHGRHAGVVRGGVGRKIAPILQAGNHVDLRWHARLVTHMGVFQIEPVRSRTALVMGNRLALAGLNAVCAMLIFGLAERDPQPALYDITVPLLDLLGQDDLWPLAYLRWEMAFLAHLGFGLDLGECAVTGAREKLVYVSPKTGRAVAQGAAGDWADRLLPLVPVLRGEGTAEPADLVAAFGVTGHFFANHVAPALDKPAAPEARARFVDLLARQI